MTLHFVDTDPDLVEELHRAFALVSDVACACGDILAVARYAIVSPANSYGFMDGGIDVEYAKFFGPTVQAAVREAVGRRPEGYLPVGAGLLIRTGHQRIPYLIVAPTMYLPEEVPPKNCYRAMRAVLRVVDECDLTGDIFCPGLATGIGKVPPKEAAMEMFQAYDNWRSRRTNR